MNYQCAKKVVYDSPGTSGFCLLASEFCSVLVPQASDVFWGIQITEEL